MAKNSPLMGNAITDTLTSESVKGLVSEYAEIGIDAILTDEVLKEIPFVNSLTSIVKIGITISDRILINKLIKFLHAFGEVASAERTAMVRKLESDPDYGKKVGEHILELLTKIDGDKKPKMIAAIFSAYAKGKIDSRTLLRLSRAVENIPGSEISFVRPFFDRSEAKPFLIENYTGQAFTNAGLAEMASGFGGIVFNASDLCKVFLALNLDL